MGDMTLKDLAERMADIDFAMLSTTTDGGATASRPMSNNGDVEYDGDSFFFTYDSSRTVSDISSDPNVGLTMQGSPGVAGMVGKPPVFIAVQGKAEIIRDKAAFERHWVPDLERWFERGIDTPGMVLLKVHATRIHYWDGMDSGEIRV